MRYFSQDFFFGQYKLGHPTRIHILIHPLHRIIHRWIIWTTPRAPSLHQHHLSIGTLSQHSDSCKVLSRECCILCLFSHTGAHSSVLLLIAAGQVATGAVLNLLELSGEEHMRDRFAVLDYCCVSCLLCIVHRCALVQITCIFCFVAFSEQNLEYF